VEVDILSKSMRVIDIDNTPDVHYFALFLLDFMILLCEGSCMT
jgi:hypothetical protein